jgi:SAM-dependent methyltransferase
MDFGQASRLFAAYQSAKLLDTIASDDEMWRGDRDWYFAIGAGGLQAILRGLVASRLTAVRTLLDLPCGHGRVARHLRAAFPEARLTFCDLNPSAVDFCAARLGGEAVVSAPDLTSLVFSHRFDVIWVGSLFTHIDRERTGRWLTFLAGQLEDDGILVATFHGRGSIEMHRCYPMIGEERWNRIRRQFEDVGYGYADYRDDQDYRYGISLSSPASIVDLASGIPGVRLLSYHERGWDDHQDVLVLARADPLAPRRTRPGALPLDSHQIPGSKGRRPLVGPGQSPGRGSGAKPPMGQSQGSPV